MKGSVDNLAARLVEELNGFDRSFGGFSDDALYLQRFLHDERWTKDSWDEVSREMYAEDVKPQLAALLSDCSKALSAATGEGFTYALASPFPHGNVAKWFWGAVVPEGRTIHNDIQMFVAMRWGYVRAGLYLNDQNRERFDRAMSGLSGKEVEASAALAMAEENGVSLCVKIPNISRGKVLPYEKSEDTWSKEFSKRREIDLLKGWEVDDDDLRVSEFAEDVLGVFAAIHPLYSIM
ncbi:MAG: hypothetical protein VYD50_01675 [Candidatus Thermoplasmatota archaeon]|nr:hypothetical protein [Candidatus Thermoplasmatota archaeon]